MFSSVHLLIKATLRHPAAVSQSLAKSLASRQLSTQPQQNQAGWGSFSTFRFPPGPPVLKGSEEVDATRVKGLSLSKLHRLHVQPQRTGRSLPPPFYEL